jgi:hypothetical protein
LQINNWNEVRKQKAQITSYTKALISDLKTDIRKVKTIRYQAEKSYLILDSLTNYCRYLDINELSNLDLYLLSSNDGYKPYSWNRASFEEIKSSGVLNYFKNDSLVNLLVSYEAFTRHMDLDYQADVESSKQARKLLNSVVNRNYNFDNKTKFITGFQNDTLKISDYPNSETYLELKKQPIEFVNKDDAKLKEAVNAYIELKSYLLTRYNYELPNLLKDATTIIEILEKNYLE